MSQYRRHTTSKAARVKHHKRMKKRAKAVGAFPYSDTRGVAKKTMSKRMGPLG